MQCPVVTEFSHKILAATVHYSSYMRSVHLKRKLTYTEKAIYRSSSYIAGCYSMISSYMMQYYSECYNRDVQVNS